MTKLWYLHILAHTSFVFQKIKGRILRVFPVLELLAHMSIYNLELLKLFNTMSTVLYNVVQRSTKSCKVTSYMWMLSLGWQISSREIELLKPNLSPCTDICFELNFVYTNTIYLNQLTWFWHYVNLTYWYYSVSCN